MLAFTSHLQRKIADATAARKKLHQMMTTVTIAPGGGAAANGGGGGGGLTARGVERQRAIVAGLGGAGAGEGALKGEEVRLCIWIPCNPMRPHAAPCSLTQSHAHLLSVDKAKFSVSCDIPCGIPCMQPHASPSNPTMAFTEHMH